MEIAPTLDEVVGGKMSFSHFKESLARFPAHDLRAIATRLGQRQRQHRQKHDWAEAIVSFWVACIQQPAQTVAQIDRLSPQAQAALRRLVAVDQLPAMLFFAQYGKVRQGRVTPAGATSAWLDPANASEELYYLGLLHPCDEKPFARTALLGIPPDLRSPLRQSVVPPATPAGQASPSQTSPSQAAKAAENRLALLHDLAQCLFYLHHQSWQAESTALDGRQRWLRPHHLARLNQHLLRPCFTPLPRSHAQAEPLRLLFFLLNSAALQQDGLISAAGWQWLAASSSQQQAILWQSGLQAPQTLRTRYRQPDAFLSDPWPHPLWQAFQALGRPSIQQDDSAQAISNLLLANPRYLAYWLAHLPDLQSLDQVVQPYVEGVWRDLMLGSGGMGSGEMDLGECDQAAATASMMTNTSWQWQAEQLEIEVAAFAALEAQAHVLAYCAEYGLRQHESLDQLRHWYRLTAQSVRRAAAGGLGMATLAEACQQLGMAVNSPAFSANWARLCDWHASAGNLQLSLATILRTNHPEELASLQQQAKTAPLIAEILSPTVAQLQGSPSQAQQRLQAAGYHPISSHPTSNPAPPTQAEATQSESRLPFATLWLAAQLYQALGNHLSLPQAIPTATLATLLSQLPPSEQAALQSQSQALQNRLQTLLDGYAQTPPPTPSDPAQWRTIIDAAIAHKTSLWLDYFSAGRNLLTHRRVDPYWVEEQGGVAYLRAYCHHAGRVLLFRLDRVMRMENGKWKMENERQQPTA